MIAFSRRAGWDLAPNELEIERQRLFREQIPVLDLTVSNPTVVGLSPGDESVLERLGSRASLDYAPHPRGISSAREQVAAYLTESRGVDVDPSRVVLTASSSESYAFVLKLLCDPGDSVLVPRPSYPLFGYLTRLEGVTSIPYRLQREDEWRLDLQQIEEVVSERTKAIFSVSPNNPTGSFLRVDELRAAVDLSSRRGLALVVDEVFAEYIWRDFPDRVRMASVEASEGLVFSLGGLSKSAGLPQLKLGWLCVGGRASLVDEALERLDVIADTYLSVGAPVQHAVAAALAQAPSFQRRLRERVESNLLVARQMTSGMDSLISALAVQAGWYLQLRLPRVMSDDRWAVFVLREAHVLVHPGAFYGFEQEGFLVLSLLAEPELFREGVERLLDIVNREVR